HVADQPAFFERVANLLKPGGLLLLATQNRRVYARWSTVAPPDPDQLRHWVDAPELRALLRPRFRIASVTTLSPEGDRGLLRLTNSVKLNRLANAILGATRVERIKERLMLGRTLYARATKR
ncbi:MAG: class I SAM-dependent methyltransferase, partial [Betaproteobacteria bacterium]|nr:class I SAM-dependent methyltransferase [Betaproteobacteria bacterium]